MAIAPAPAPDAQSAPPAQGETTDGGGPGAGVGGLIDGIHSGLAQLMQIFVKSPGIPDEFKQKLDSVGKSFAQLIQEMSQGQGDSQQGPGAGPAEPSGPVPMEAGANKNVQPAM